jgi:hypothetical protein
MRMLAGGPVWLLDVDGVLNASRPGWSAAPFSSRVVADGRAHRFRWAPQAVALVREVTLAGLEVRWCSTWVPWAREVEEVFRLPELPLAFSPEAVRAAPGAQAVDALKVAAALHVVEVERRPLVWTDDQVVPLGGALRERLEGAGVPVLLLRPRESRGLRPEDAELIRAFVLEFSPASG